MTPTASVVICTRNRAPDLAWALPCVLANTYDSYEVLIVDQSDDSETGKIVEAVATGDKRVKYIRTAPRGKSGALNLGISQAKGNIVLCTDDDCETPQSWISDVMARFEDEPSIDLLYGQVHAPAEYDTENLAVPCLYFDKRRTLEFGETFGMGANMSLRKQVFEKVGGYDVCLGPGTALPGAEEGDFCYRAQLAGARVDLDPEVVLVHRATRSVAEWNDVIRVYGVGDAAFHQKHVRCGDLLALRRVLCTILRQTARAVVNPLFRGKGRTDYYLRGYLVGLLRSSRLGVDRERRMYIHPDQYKDVCRPEGTMNRRAVVGVSKK